MARKIISLIFLVLIGKMAYSAPFSEAFLHLNATNQPRIPHEADKILFPTRLDGISSTPSFRIITKKDKFVSLPTSLSESLDTLFIPQLIRSKQEERYLTSGVSYQLPRNFVMETHYNDYERFGPKYLQDPGDSAKVLKMTSLGVAYPLTSKLVLDGHYALIKGGLDFQALSPLFGATYRVNAGTSISVSYNKLSEESKKALSSSQHSANDASAELKIHF